MSKISVIGMLKFRVAARWLIIRFAVLRRIRDSCVTLDKDYKKDISLFELNTALLEHGCRLCHAQDCSKLRNCVLNKNHDIVQYIYEYSTCAVIDETAATASAADNKRPIENNAGNDDDGKNVAFQDHVMDEEIHFEKAKPVINSNHNCLYFNMLHACYDWTKNCWSDKFVTKLLFEKNLYLILKLKPVAVDCQVVVNTLCLKNDDKSYLPCLNALIEKRFIVKLNRKLANVINDDGVFENFCLKACAIQPRLLQSYKLDKLFLSRGISVMSLYEKRVELGTRVDFVRFKLAHSDVMFVDIPCEMLQVFLLWLNRVGQQSTNLPSVWQAEHNRGYFYDADLREREQAWPKIVCFNRTAANELMHLAWKYNEYAYLKKFDEYTTTTKPQWREWTIRCVPETIFENDMNKYLGCALTISKHIRSKTDFEKFKLQVGHVWRNHNGNPAIVNALFKYTHNYNVE
nr:hp [Calliteara abietis nucleopolyhedrovirus]